MTVIQSKYNLKENELYETEEWATRALLRNIYIRGKEVWEPCAGNHKIANVCREAGAIVITSDIVEYDKKHNFIVDFFINDEFYNYDAIITNPPYGPGNTLATKFARLALERCDGIVALLLTSKFDFGSTRTDLFRDNPRFTAKINLIDRISWMGNGKTGTEDHAWYIWTNARPTENPIILYEGNDEKDIRRNRGKKNSTGNLRKNGSNSN